MDRFDPVDENETADEIGPGGRNLSGRTKLVRVDESNSFKTWTNLIQWIDLIQCTLLNFSSRGLLKVFLDIIKIYWSYLLWPVFTIFDIFCENWSMIFVHLLKKGSNTLMKIVVNVAHGKFANCGYFSLWELLILQHFGYCWQ